MERHPVRRVRQIPCPANSGRLVQQRLPVGWHPSRGSRSGLIFRMRVRGKQLHTLHRDHGLLLVIVKPILTRFEAGDDRMPCRCGMLGRMLIGRTVTASDVPTLGTPAEMKPPTFRRRQALHTPVATWLRSEVDSAVIFLHFVSSLGRCMSSKSLSHQQDLPRTTFFCRRLSLGRFTEWQFLANRDYELAISHRFGHELKRFPVEFREYMLHLY